MRYFSILTFAALFSVAAAAPTETVPMPTCANERIDHTAYVGKDNNVKVTYSHCDEALVDTEGRVVSSLTRRQSSNVCSAPCETYCWSGTTGAPTNSDCDVIVDALLYDSQAIGANFQINAVNTSTNKITMQYNTCLTYFLNQDYSTLTYCRTEWSKLVTWLSSDCSPTNDAFGGLCVADDQRWYVQLQHS